MYVYMYVFLKKEEGRCIENRNINEGGTSSIGCPCMHPHWGLSSQPDMCPDGELNQLSLASWVHIQLLSHTGRTQLCFPMQFWFGQWDELQVSLSSSDVSEVISVKIPFCFCFF